MQGYHGDTSATYFVGEVDEKVKDLVKVCLAFIFSFFDSDYIF